MVTIAVAAQSRPGGNMKKNLPPLGKPGISLICLILSYCASSWQETTDNEGLVVRYQWSQLEFNYSSQLARQQAIDSGEFNPRSAFPMDVDVLYTPQSKTVFITMPRSRGVPITLGTVTDALYNGNPIIAPYPNWTWHQHTEECLPDRMVSVYRVQLDKCGKLWVLDNGRLLNKNICPAQILAFDTKTNEVIHRYEIPASQMETTSLLTTIIVDVRDHECQDNFVYVADSQDRALIVHDVKKMKSWKITDKTMYPYPNFGTFHIAGQSFDLMDGILGLDVSPYKSEEDRILYFHALSSGTENWVHTSKIRNEALFANSTTPAPQIFHTYPNKRHSQVPGMAIDRNGIAYFGQASDTSMSCWNTKTPYKEQNIHEIARNPVTIQFPSGVKVISKNDQGQELWFLTMRIQKVYTGTLNLSDVNFRIHAGGIDHILRHSKCGNDWF